MDTWALVSNAPGPTWPLYLEDQLPPPSFFAHSFAWERIDLIFSQGLTVLGVEHIPAPGPAVNVWPYFGSDHAGVMATFQF